MADLQFKALRKSFDQTEILHGIDLTVADGEFMVFVGPSGCGKSTMLRCIAGLEEITSGELHIGGQLVNEIPPSKRSIAMVFQSYALYPHMSVAKNMAFGLKLAGMSQPEIDTAVQRAAQILKIEPLLERRPKDLSGGQRQRVAIGRAIVRKPGVFLFDEPLSNLDAALRVQMRVELARLHRELQTTMVYVTHDQVEAMTLASRIAVFHAGVIEQVGTPMQLYHQPANLFVAGFIGSPTMNFMPGQLESATAERAEVRLDSGHLVTAHVDASRLQRGAAVTLGVRPEHLLASTLPGDNAVRGTVQAAEHLGDVTYLYLQVAGVPQTVVSRTDPENPLNSGDMAHLVLPPHRCHLFDAQGLALPRRT
ncbi:sn-glycerol-3-phosphate ABC transporter ATP-binding protein UgpC [Sphaerotilus sp.]|uniref:ABC transporter ATP-binding protein n=1 Tax=Sphaerotilus sp. TaxID=2093942 RepID=UPI00286D749D|nr:sn-glycerol-3-phosphate ABC transporter ATP-binding protein UgpC [Sphaerotilus sp.]